MYRVENMEQSKAAFGIFKNNGEVRTARLILNSLGFTNSDIAILYPPHLGPQDFSQHQRNEVKHGAMIGAAIGGVLLFAAGVFLSARMSAIDLATSSPNNPQFYQLIVLGLVGLISGIILGAACGALAGIGIPERAGNRYGDYVDAGGILMSVHVDDANKAQAAQEILQRAGAQDVNLIQEKAGWDTVFTKIVRNQKPYENPIDVEH